MQPAFGVVGVSLDLLYSGCPGKRTVKRLLFLNIQKCIQLLITPASDAVFLSIPTAKCLSSEHSGQWLMRPIISCSGSSRLSWKRENADSVG